MRNLGSLFFIGISGHRLSEEEKKYIIKNDISGVTLFKRNILNPKQLKQLCAEIKSLAKHTQSKLAIFIAIDMEGGQVHRLSKSDFKSWPAVGTLYKGDLKQACLDAFDHGFSMGSYLKSLGINLNWSPCLDVLTNKNNKIIGDRALNYLDFLSSKKKLLDLKAIDSQTIVSRLGESFLKAFNKSQILCCAKHFPGHGNTLLDSHKALPVENLCLKQLQDRELQSFKMAIKNNVPFIMTAHILFKNIDKTFPVSLSSFFIKNLLKKQLAYKGIVISDDLDMQSLKAYQNSQKALLALRAGCDMLLYCNNPQSYMEVLDFLNSYKFTKKEEEEIKLSLKKIFSRRRSLGTKTS